MARGSLQLVRAALLLQCWLHTHTILSKATPCPQRAHEQGLEGFFLAQEVKKKKDMEQEPRQDLLTSAADFVSKLPSIKLEATAREIMFV